MYLCAGLSLNTLECAHILPCLLNIFHAAVSAGDAVAARMDSKFIDVWNRGFNTILTNGQFNALCKSADSKHGKTVTSTPTFNSCTKLCI